MTPPKRKDWRRGPRPGEHRTECIRVQLYPAERAAIERAADAANHTISDYVRKAAELFGRLTVAEVIELVDRKPKG